MNAKPLSSMRRAKIKLAIFTFDSERRLIQTFGDLAWFASNKERALIDVVRGLLDLEERQLAKPSSIKVGRGHPADVQIVPDGTLRHVVLRETEDEPRGTIVPFVPRP